MPSTTLKLPDILKARIGPLAAAEGLTPHAWMIVALGEQVSLAERRASFVQDARTAAAEVDATGEVFAAEDVHAYLRDKLAGKAPRKPRAIKA